MFTINDIPTSSDGKILWKRIPESYYTEVNRKTFLPENSDRKEKFYYYLNGISAFPSCAVCGKQFRPKIISVQQGGTNVCSKSCAAKNCHKSGLATKIILYGSTNNIEKRKETCLQKYGDAFFTNREKYRTTMNDKYGVDCNFSLNENKIKQITTNLEKYGVPYPMMSEDVRRKSKDTCLQKYGVENISQSMYVQKRQTKSMYNKKVFTMPSGKTYIVQGYEPTVIERLLSNGYLEEEIELQNKPTIKYFWCSTDGYGDGKWHVYHPDIILPNENKIIEVKSSWTYNGKPEWLSKNLAKQKYAIKEGFDFQFVIVK